MAVYRVELTRTTTAVGYFEVEAESAEKAEELAEERLESEDPEEVDVSFGPWEVTHGGMTEEVEDAEVAPPQA